MQSKTALIWSSQDSSFLKNSAFHCAEIHVRFTIRDIWYVHSAMQASPVSSSRTFHRSTIKLCPIAVISHSSPLQPRMHFLSLWIYLFGMFHINGIIQHVALYVVLLSPYQTWRFIIDISEFHSFSFLSNIPLYGYTVSLFIHLPVNNIWVNSNFWLLWIKYTHFYISFCLIPYFQLSWEDMTSRSGIPGSFGDSIFNIFSQSFFLFLSFCFWCYFFKKPFHYQRKHRFRKPRRTNV